MKSENQPYTLITGLPGIPGYNCFHYFRKKWGERVIGLKPAHTEELEYPGVYALNGEDLEGLEDLFRKYSFGRVIDASGCCALKSCEYNPALADTLNTRFGTHLAKLAKRSGAQLIRFSTDLVFDGAAGGNYREEDTVCPITIYGKTMALAEANILNEHPAATLFRIPLPMGPSLNGHAGAVDWIENRFKKGNPATLYYDEVRSNIYIQDVLQVVEHFLHNPLGGIFHLGGPLPLTLYQIAQIVNKVGGYPPHLLKGCYRHEAGPIPPRVGNVSMDISKLESVLPPGTLNPWPLNPVLIPNSKDWHYTREGKESSQGAFRELYGYGQENHSSNPLHWHGNEEYFNNSLARPKPAA